MAKAGGIERRLKGGLGTACEQGPDGLLAGALAAANAAGDIIDPDSGRAIAAARADGGGFLDGWELIRSGTRPDSPPGQNTTLVVVATNALLSKEQANRLASVAHDGLARTVRPAHGIDDGDTVFVLATGEVPAEERRSYRALEAITVRAVERAIVRSVRSATGLAGVPSAQEWSGRR